MGAHIHGAELTFTTSQGPIALRRWGLGESFLLFPGLGGSSVSWGKVPHLIAKSGAAALAFEPPQWLVHSKSEDDYNLLAQCLLPLVKTLRTVHYVGWSLGCRLALRLAEYYQPLSTTLIAPNLEEMNDQLLQILQNGAEHWAESMKPHIPETVRLPTTIKCYLSVPQLERQYAQAKKTFQWKIGNHGPTRIIYGLDDRLIEESSIKKTSQRLSAEVLSVPGGHFLPWTHPEIILSCLKIK